MSTEKIGSVIRISREELLAQKDFQNYVWEDGALRIGYTPVVGNLKQNPDVNEFCMQLEGDSVSYSVHNFDGKIKQGKIKQAELQAELGDQYNAFILALKEGKPHQLVPFIKNILNIELKKGKPIDNKPKSIEVYKDSGRSFYINEKNFTELYEKEFGKGWTLSSDQNSKTNKNTDTLIKKALKVDDAALVEFKRAYVQSIWYVNSDLFSRLGFELQTNHIKGHLYKTREGRIGIRTELNIESITNPLEGKAYNLKGKIEVDWEPNTQGELQFKSMYISGPDSEVVAKLFTDTDKAAFLKQLAPLEIPLSETRRESLINLQKWIDLMEHNNLLPDWAKNYVNAIKKTFKDNLFPKSLFDEIQALPLPKLTTAAAGDENRAFLSHLRNLFENSDTAALQKSWNHTCQKKIDNLQEVMNEERKGMDPKDFVEKISKRWVIGKEVLLEAAKIDKSIYQEIVDPKITLSYIFRQIGEFLGLVDPRPEFTTQDHLAVLANHPELLDDPKKDNLYRAILQNASPEEKLLYLSSEYLSLDDKLSLLSTYMIDPTKSLSSLGKGFFSTLNKEICAVLRETKDEDRYMAVCQSLDKWLLEDDFQKVQWLRSTDLNESFIESQKGFSDSPESIAYRLNLLLKGNDLEGNVERFGSAWRRKLMTDLDSLAKSGKLTSLPRSTEIQSIIDTINKHEVLYNACKENPRLNTVLNPSFNKEVENQAKVVTAEVQKLDKVAGKSVDEASRRVELTEEPYEPPRSAPINIPTRPSH